MAMWNPWRGCHKHSEGCKYCYIHKGDYKRRIDTNNIVKTDNFYAPIAKNKSGAYKIKSGQMVYLCFSTDFLIEDADGWRGECWNMIRERSDLHFIFLTKRIERFMDCVPSDWNDGYENVTVGCTVENQDRADYRLSPFIIIEESYLQTFFHSLARPWFFNLVLFTSAVRPVLPSPSRSHHRFLPASFRLPAPYSDGRLRRLRHILRCL